MAVLRGNFEQEIEGLQDSIKTMGELAEQSVKMALIGLVEKETESAERSLELEDKINQLQTDIDDDCTRLIATEQPVATDLRMLLTTLSVVASLERIGDMAVHIARVAIKLADQPYIKRLIDIPRMGDIARSMIVDSVRSYVARDAAMAKEVASRDDQLDDTYSQLFRELLTYMMENAKVIDQAMSLLFCAKQIERMGDLTTNISEAVMFVTTGKRVDLNR